MSCTIVPQCSCADDITLYCLTSTGVSSYKADFFDAKNITIPFAISGSPDELYQASRSWAERAYPHDPSTSTNSTGGRFTA